MHINSPSVGIMGARGEYAFVSVAACVDETSALCVAVCCSVLQCVAVCCSVLQCAVVRCSV